MKYIGAAGSDSVAYSLYASDRGGHLESIRRQRSSIRHKSNSEKERTSCGQSLSGTKSGFEGGITSQMNALNDGVLGGSAGSEAVVGVSKALFGRQSSLCVDHHRRYTRSLHAFAGFPSDPPDSRGDRQHGSNTPLQQLFPFFWFQSLTFVCSRLPAVIFWQSQSPPIAILVYCCLRLRTSRLNIS
jgi:hypothetical protein